MTDDDLCEVIITAPDRDWLVDLCRQLVDARLASSAHVIHPVTSIYRWEGAVHETTEARAFLRSRCDLLDDLTAYVVERHPYEVPNVTALPIVGGNPDYLAWIDAETAERETSQFTPPPTVQPEGQPTSRQHPTVPIAQRRRTGQRPAPLRSQNSNL